MFWSFKKSSSVRGLEIIYKRVLERHKIPTAEYECFSDIDLAINYVQKKEFPIVIKADGLAAGKGVVIANTFDERKSQSKIC